MYFEPGNKQLQFSPTQTIGGGMRLLGPLGVGEGVDGECVDGPGKFFGERGVYGSMSL